MISYWGQISNFIKIPQITASIATLGRFYFHNQNSFIKVANEEMRRTLRNMQEIWICFREAWTKFTFGSNLVLSPLLTYKWIRLIWILLSQLSLE